MTEESRFRCFTNEQWARVEPLLPSNVGRRGRPFGDHRRVVEGMVYRYRTGIPWRDLPYGMGHGKRYGNATTTMPGMAPGIRYWLISWPKPMPRARSMGTCQWMLRSTGHINTAPIPPAPISPQGAFRITRICRSMRLSQPATAWDDPVVDCRQRFMTRQTVTEGHYQL